MIILVKFIFFMFLVFLILIFPYDPYAGIDIWLQSTFPWDICSSYFDESAQNDPIRCLINNPSITMSHPVLDFNVVATCDWILEKARTLPDDRNKSVLGVVRGMGSGKTRCLEEIRRELLRRPGTLPIGISFNNANFVIDNELKWVDDYSTVFALMVIARCASTLYGIGLDKIREIVSNKLHKLDRSIFKNVGRNLLEEFLRFVVNKARSRGMVVNDVVIIVDEVVKAEEALFRQFKNVLDGCSVLREAVLSSKSTPFNFNATLCISSLEVSPLGLTKSGRPVESLGIPSILSAQRIVSDWWKCKKEDERMFLYVAACVNSLPRATQIVGEYLKDYSDRCKDQTFIQGLFKYLRNQFESRYLWKEFPSNDIIYSILFAEEVVLDEKIQEYISRSILLNSIETYLPKTDKIVPTSSLAVLASIRSNNSSSIERYIRNIYGDVLDEIVSLAEKKRQKGIPFESFVAKWIEFRWFVAYISGNNVRLRDLLGIGKDEVLKGIFRDVLEVTITSEPPDIGDLNINSNEDPVGHMNEVELLIVNATHRILIRRGAANDKFDLLIIIYMGDNMAPLRLYIDHKSPSPDDPKSVDKYYNESATLKQYENVKSMCKDFGVPFLFSYWTHYPGSLSIRDDCFILRENESKAFFGPMWPIFITCRSTF